MATLATFKSLLRSPDSTINEIIECALDIDWSAALEADTRVAPLTDANLEAGQTDCGVDVHDAICALYWYCADHHGGQGSQEYALGSSLGHDVYTPGSCENGPEEDTCSMDVYNRLEELARSATQ